MRSPFVPSRFFLLLALAACGGDGGSGPGTGAVRITTVTTGQDLPAASYQVTVGSAAAAGVNDHVPAVVSGLPAGALDVVLGNVPANCQVADGASHRVTVGAGDTVAATFAVSCTSTHGAVRVVVNTTGTGAGGASYGFTIQGTPAGTLAANDSAVVVGLLAGPATVVLTGATANCAVSGGIQHTVSVVGGDTVRAAFVVGCTALGSVKVVTTTTGTPPDADGYTVHVAGVAAQTVGANDSIVVGGVAVGDLAFTVGGVAGNCAPTTSVPTWVRVQADQVTRVEITVACRVGRILYTSRPSETTPNTAYQIYATSPDGSGAAQLTHEVYPLGAFQASWSPDRSKIAYTLGDNSTWSAVAVINADGSGRTLLTPEGGQAGRPVWSPDGTKILYSLGNGLAVMNADGTGQTPLPSANPPYSSAVWSLSGDRIYYVSRPASSSGFFSLFVMNADGSSQAQVSTTRVDLMTNCAMSPSGIRILFDRDTRPDDTQPVNEDIFAMGLDGSGPVTVLGTSFYEGDGCWSPDGSQMLFLSDRDTPGSGRLYVMDANGTGIRAIPGITTRVYQATWR